MFKKVATGLLCFLLLSVFTLSGCNQAPTTASSSMQSSTSVESKANYSGRTVSLLIGSVVFGDAYKNLFTDFQTDTGIKMDVQVVPGAAAEFTKIVQVKIATKSLPDMLMAGSGPMYLNTFNPIENIVEVTNKEWINKMQDGLKSLGGTYQGKVYGIPFGGTDFTGLLYSEKIFADLSLTPPKNFDELVAVCDKIKASGKGITPIYEMAKQGGPLSAFVYTDVARLYSEDLGIMDRINTGKIGFEDTFILASLSRKMELQKKGFFNDDMMSGTWETFYKALSENKAAMAFVYSNVLPNLYKSYPDVKVKLIPLNGVAVTTFTQAIYIMKTENKDMSTEFVNYFLKDSSLTKLYTSLKAVPAYKGIVANVEPSLSPMVELLAKGKIAPVFFDQLAANVGQVPLLQEMHTNIKTPEKVCIALTQKMKQLGQEMGLPGFK